MAAARFQRILSTREVSKDCQRRYPLFGRRYPSFFTRWKRDTWSLTRLRLLGSKETVGGRKILFDAKASEGRSWVDYLL